MRILQLISSGGFYGAESVLLNLSTELKRCGHECQLGVFENAHNPNAEMARRAQESGLDTTVIPCIGRVDWGAVRAIRALAQGGLVDLIHTHGYKADLYAYMAMRRSDVPLVATCHSWPGKDRSMRFYGWMDRFMLRYFDCVAAVSESTKAKLLAAGHASNRVTKISNGVPIGDVRDRAGASQGDTVGNRLRIGTVGRLSREKGHTVLLKAAKKLSSEHPKALFLFAGDGPERQVLERETRELGLEEQVVFTGVRHDLAGFYESLDVFVMPSLHEALPMALLEAMAAGLAVVATIVGDISHVLSNGETGLLVAPGDVEALAKNIGALLCDAHLRQRLGGRARARVRTNYSAERMAEQYLKLYDQALRRRVPRLVHATTARPDDFLASHDGRS
jgi:glycosyltransferase involved in cell wall biosynthesis